MILVFVLSNMNRNLAREFASLLKGEVTGREKYSAIAKLQPELCDGYCSTICMANGDKPFHLILLESMPYHQFRRSHSSLLT